MSEWRSVTLGEITEWASGGTPPKDDPRYWGGDIPWISASSMHGNRYSDSELRLTQEGLARGSRLVEPGTVLLLVRGGALHQRIPVGIATRPVAFNQDVKAIKVRKGLSPWFLLYWLLAKEKELLGIVSFTGIGAGKFDTKQLQDLPVLLPPPEEQETIIAVAKALDDKIELNRRMNETLEAIARAMFKSWFVDFDPVRAKMSGEPPDSICQRLGLTPDLFNLFPDRLVDSELGEIPEGWRVGTIGDHCYLNAKSWTAKTIPDEVHYIDLANVKNGIISEVQIFSSEIAPSRARRILRAGDTIVGTVRPGNRSFSLIGEGEHELTGSTGFAVLSPKRQELRELVFFLATSEENIDRLSRLADGAAYPAVRPEVVTAGACVIPGKEIIDAFNVATATMIDYQIANRACNNTLGAARDTLLPKLLSGELRLIS